MEESIVRWPTFPREQSKQRTFQALQNIPRDDSDGRNLIHENPTRRNRKYFLRFALLIIMCEIFFSSSIVDVILDLNNIWSATVGVLGGGKAAAGRIWWFSSSAVSN